MALTNPFDLPTVELPGGGFRYERGYEEIVAQISNTGDLGEEWITRHKWELEQNQLLIQDWGFQSSKNLKDGFWTAEEIKLLNGAEIYSKGILSQIRGFHPRRIVGDDLENREQARNPKIREKNKLYFFSDLYGAMTAESSMVVAGTFVHPEGLLKQLYERDIIAPVGLEESPVFQRPWEKFFYAALDRDNNPMAPEFWSYESLMLKKAELFLQGMESVWFSEYMNAPRVGENPIYPEVFFNKERNHYDSRGFEFRENILPTLSDRIIFLDAVVKDKEVNDFASLTAIGFKRQERPKIYVLAHKRFRKLIDGQIDEVLEFFHKWHGHVYMQDVPADAMVAARFKKKCEEEMLQIPLRTVRYQEKKHEGEPTPKLLDKVGLAQKLIHFFINGEIHFDFYDEAQLALIEELKGFPEGQYKDQVDSLNGCLWVAEERLRKIEDKAKGMTSYQFDPDTGRPITASQPSYVDPPNLGLDID